MRYSDRNFYIALAAPYVQNDCTILMAPPSSLAPTRKKGDLAVLMQSCEFGLVFFYSSVTGRLEKDFLKWGSQQMSTSCAVESTFEDGVRKVA